MIGEASPVNTDSESNSSAVATTTRDAGCGGQVTVNVQGGAVGSQGDRGQTGPAGKASTTKYFRVNLVQILDKGGGRILCLAKAGLQVCKPGRRIRM